MSRKAYILMVSIWAASALNTLAQPFGNEWINYSQQYYKVKVAQDAIYRIDYNTLVSAGFPVSTVDPRRVSVFYRGQEVAVTVAGELDARFDPGDYIEFFGKRNDGTLDKELYIEPEAHKNPYYNIYSDSSAYFITWNQTEYGRRIQTYKENNVDNLPALTSVSKESVNLYANEYELGRHYVVAKDNAGRLYYETFSYFDYGEGWTGTTVAANNSLDYYPDTVKAINKTSAQKPQIEMLLVARNNNTQRAQIWVGPPGGTVRMILDTAINERDSYVLRHTLEWSDFSAAGAIVARLVVGDGSRLSVSYIKILADEVPDLESRDLKYFTVKNQQASKSYVEMANASGVRVFDITNEQNIIQVGHNQSPSGINFILRNTSVDRKLIVTSRVVNVSVMRKVQMLNLGASNPDFFIVTHPLLRQATSEYLDPVKAYADYRSSADGGSFNPLVVNIDQLYDVLSYGETTSLAMYRLARYIYQPASNKYIFIIGKGLTPNYNSHRKDFNTQQYKDLIPTGGYPGSDQVFTAFKTGATRDHKSKIPIGRVAFANANQVQAYLNKVKEAEAFDHNALWKKDILHMGGGRTTSEQYYFLNALNTYKAVAEGEYLGGSVSTKTKKTGNETELISIASEVNNGLGMITMFGHSGLQGNDMDIGYVSNTALGYNNKGKYPLLFVNGCAAGDMYYASYGFGEDWIATPDKGSVNFLAHTGVGVSSVLDDYTEFFYKTGFGDSTFIYKSVGAIQMITAHKLLDAHPNDEKYICQAHLMSLQGDPAIALFGARQPDYDIVVDNVEVQSVDGNPISAFSESFNLVMIIRNFGRTDQQPMNVSVKWKLSDGSEYQLDTLSYSPVFYQDTIVYQVQNELGLKSFGNNEFYITIDPGNEIQELNKTNNLAILPYFMHLGGASNKQPRNFAMVKDSTINLVVQSLQLLEGERTFLIELDTTSSFNSPALRSNSVTASVLATWQVNLFQNIPFRDSTTFYWRTRYANPKPDELDEWMLSSFTFISGSYPGWHLGHFDQYINLETEELKLNDINRSWEFKTFDTRVEVKVFGADHPTSDYTNTELKVNGDNLNAVNTCADNALNLVAFRSTTTAPYVVLRSGPIDLLDRLSCGRRPQVINIFREVDILPDREYIVSYINGVIDGDYVVMFSNGTLNYSTWPQSSIDKLTEIGIDPLDMEKLNAGDPFIVLGVKGSAPGTATFLLPDPTSGVPTSEQELSLDVNIEGSFKSGELVSPLIGPVRSWGEFSYNVDDTQNQPGEQTTFQVWGIDKNAQQTLIYDDVNNNTDLSAVSVSQYPHLKLKMRTENARSQVPAQLKRLTVTFDPLPDLLIQPAADQPSEGLKAREGDTLYIRSVITNIGEVGFTDSIAVQTKIFNQTSRMSEADTIKIAPLASLQSTTLSSQLLTRHRVGMNDFEIFVNPNIQPELSFNNNKYSLNNLFEVEADEINPLLEVTVDGAFIMDGDIVSPNPLIAIRMKDENEILHKTDTAGIEIYLKKPCEACLYERVNFSSDQVTWTPASANNDFAIEYRPQALPDGVYGLKVQVTDASGNKSGDEPYGIHFEVVNESSITHFYPYPNPFSTSTRFVFTLTGSDIPDELKIQIMTITGRVVREITQDEIGPLKIGHNQTAFAWDGRDEYGDQLANGVYLYRVMIRNAGEKIMHRATPADKGFINGVGKMYLLK